MRQHRRACLDQDVVLGKFRAFFRDIHILDAAVGGAEVLAHGVAHAIEVDKHNSPVYLARGRALEKLERWPDAIAVYKSGIEVASRKGDLMPLKEMEHRLLLLGGR